MDITAGCTPHVGMTALFVYTSSTLCFRFRDKLKQMPLRVGVFLIMTPQKSQQQSKNSFLDQCVQAYTSDSGLS